MKYNDVSRPNIESLYSGLLPDENYMGSVCLKQKGVITFPDPPEALSNCILTRGDQVAEEVTATGQSHMVRMKILHPTSKTELEITARVNSIIDCTKTSTKPKPTTNRPPPVANNQNISSPSSNDSNVEVTHQPVELFIASIIGTLTFAAVITTAVCCFKKKRRRVPGTQSYDVNPVYGTVYYHQDRCL